MNKKYIGAIVLATAIIGGLYAVSNTTADDTLKIGVILPLTGKTASIGETSANLMEMLREDLNKQFPNHTIEILVEDSAGDAKTSVAAAQKLVEVDKVEALYVAFTSPTLAALPVAQKAGIVFAHSTFTDIPVTTYDRALKTFIDYRDLCANQGKLFTQKGYGNVVALSNSNGLAEICAESLAATFKGEIKIVNISTDTNIKTEMLKLKQKGFDAILSSSFEPDMIAVFKANSEIGYKPEIICNIATCATTNILKQFTDEELSNVVVHTTAVKKEFEDRYIAKYGSLPSSGLTNPVFDYEMVMDIAQGLISCGGKNPDCVVEKTRSSKAQNGGLTNYEWKGRYMVPEVEYYKIVDGQFVRK